MEGYLSGFIRRVCCGVEGIFPSCACLTIKNRLGTRDRLSRWDNLVPSSCMLSCLGCVVKVLGRV